MQISAYNPGRGNFYPSVGEGVHARGRLEQARHLALSRAEKRSTSERVFRKEREAGREQGGGRKEKGAHLRNIPYIEKKSIHLITPRGKKTNTT